MINRILIIVLIGFFTSICLGLSDADFLKQEADKALENGDIETALELYFAVVELDPEDGEMLEMVASLAAELDLGEVSVEMWIQRAELGAGQSDVKAVLKANVELTELHQRLPGWVEAKLSEANQINAEQADVVETWAEMTAESQAALTNGEMQAAIASQENVVFIAAETFGESHWLTISAMRDLGYIYQQAGNSDKAEDYYGEALMAAETLLGENHPNTLQINQLMAGLYHALGLNEAAEALIELAADGFEASLGASHELSVNARLNQIEFLKHSGAYQSAMESLLGLCATVDLGYGIYHSKSIRCLESVADLQQTLGRLAAAEASYEQAITRMSLSIDSVDASVINTLSQLAEVYRVMGRYQESKDLLSGVIQTAIQIGEIEGSYIARSYLGRVLANEGQIDKAETMTEEVLDYGIQRWQEEPIKIFNVLLELGAIYQAQSRLADAEATFAEVLEGVRASYGDYHPTTMLAGNALGQILEKRGLYDQAEPLIKETLKKMEATLGEEHPDTLRVRNNLGLIHESQGNFREAEPLYLKSLELLKLALGENHTDTIAVKNNLAYLYMLMQDFEASARIFAEVQQQWAGLFGEDHQNTLKASNSLGRTYQKLGRLDEAEQQILDTLERRRRVLGREHIDSIRSMIDLGVVYLDQGKVDEANEILTQALSLAEDELGNLHPYTFDALNLLSRALEDASSLQAAVELREVGFKRRSRFLDTMLWAAGENAREGYIRLHRGEFNQYLSLLARLNDAASAKRMINASLQRKGLLLKVTSEIQQIGTMTRDPELKQLASALKNTRKQLAAMTLSGPTAETQGRHTQVLYEIEQKVNELQGELGRASIRYRTSIAEVNADLLVEMIPEGTALVDFMVYEEGNEAKLLATVITHQDGKLRYQLIQYGNRKAVDDIVIEYRTIIQDDLADEDELLDVGMLAYEIIWLPLEDALQGAQYVYLIPDGILNILPFNALVGADEKYLIQTYDAHILTSGRDLIPNDYRFANGEYLVIAGPDYDSVSVVSDKDLEAARGRRSSALKLGIRGAGGGLRGLSFSPLPGAAKEGQIIVDQVTSNDVPNQNFFGASAQESILSNLTKPPEIIHIATHGFFLEADDTLRKRILKAQRSADIHVPPPGDNPLLRAGLAFAGINTNAQFLGDIDTANDGILTALEVLDLNLSGTRLVVLSACETGLGEIHEGEGVYGLRRSFQEAGVAEVISSLWEVSDAGTQALMTDFYDQLLSGIPARQALRNVQLELIDSPVWGYPYIWSAFMIVGSYESAGFNVN